MFLKKDRNKKVSYSQSGEDLIVRRTLNRLGIKDPTYLDIGTNDPIKNNNTYLFYTLGSRGVLVEPDSEFTSKINKERKKDKFLNCGIGTGDSKIATFYSMSNSSLSTFSEKEAEATGQKIVSKKEVKLVGINEIVEKYFDKGPNFISLDVEGMDYEILKTFNFEKNRPEVWCIETINYTQNNTETKRNEIINFMEAKGYLNFADTYINTIFVDKAKWIKR